MIILGVRLRNIRSYRDKTIVFPQRGVTVIYGDVGTGKSTILSSISYAIFGQSSGLSKSSPLERFALPKAEDLLRVGENRGSITLLLKQGNKLVLIERIIAREGGRPRTRYVDKGGVLRVYVIRKKDDGTVEYKLAEARMYSAQELRQRILELLGLPEPHKRRKPLVFTNAIYVPQFGVHDVIGLSEQDRKDLVNTVINLSRYSNAREGIEALARGKRSIIGSIINELRARIEERERRFEGKSLEDIEREIRGAEEEARRLEEEKKRVEGKLEKLKEAIEEKRRRLSDEQRRIATIEQSLSEIRRLKEKRNALQKQLTDLLKQLGIKGLDEIEDARARLKEEIKRIEGRICALNNQKNRIQEEIERLEEEINSLEEKERGLSKNLAKIEADIRGLERRKCDIENEIKRITGLIQRGICPVCGQRVTHDHGRRLLEEKKADLKKVKEEIERLLGEERKVKAEIGGVEDRLRDARDKRRKLREELRLVDKELTSAMRMLSDKKSLLERAGRAGDLAESLREIEEKISMERELEEKKNAVMKKIEELRREIEGLKHEAEELNRRAREISEKTGRIIEKLGNLRSLREEYKRVMEEVSRLRRELEFYERASKFLYDRGNGVFMKILDVVESRVRRIAFSYFRRMFIEYFTHLMEGHEVISVDIAPDFTPIIRARAGASVGDITQPSGGQLTSISLAYRLALNQVARAMVPQLRKSTLILDEPTYGFSPERVDRLKELLLSISEQGISQIIIVTHDQNLLAVGDCRIRLSIDKERNETIVDYEECALDESYRSIVEELLKKKSLGGEQEIASIKQPTTRFKPAIETSIDASRREEKPRPERRRRTLFDYIG